jgi:hypothetical protein
VSRLYPWHLRVIPRHLQLYPGIYIYTLAFELIPWHLHLYPGICTYTLPFAVIPWHLHLYPGICTYTLEFALIPWHLHLYLAFAVIPRHLHLYPGICGKWNRPIRSRDSPCRLLAWLILLLHFLHEHEFVTVAARLSQRLLMAIVVSALMRDCDQGLFVLHWTLPNVQRCRARTSGLCLLVTAYGGICKGYRLSHRPAGATNMVVLRSVFSACFV